MRTLLNEMVQLGDNGRWIFESYVRNLMAETTPAEYLWRLCVGKSDDSYKNESLPIKLGGCTSIKLAVDIIDAVKMKQNTVFHSTNNNFRLIDFIYKDNDGTYHAFQVTTGLNHPAKQDDIINLVTTLSPAKVCLYYAVPSNRFTTFVTTPVNPFKNLEKSVQNTIKIRHLCIADPNHEQESVKVSNQEQQSVKMSKQKRSEKG
jgi:hypothetical protein